MELAQAMESVGVVCDRESGVRISAVGRLASADCRELEDVVYGWLDRRPAVVLVDLSAATFGDVSAIHTLLRIVDQAHSTRIEFSLSPSIERQLEQFGVRHHLAPAPDSRPRRSRVAPRPRRRARRAARMLRRG